MGSMFKSKPKPKPDEAKGKLAPSDRPTATPKQADLGNAAVQEMMPDKQEEPPSSLLDPVPERAAPTKKKKKPAKEPKKPLSPEEVAERDAAVEAAMRKAGLVAGPKKENAPKEKKAAKDPNAPAKKSMGSRMGSAVRGVGSAASSAASAVGSGVSSAAKGVKKAFGPAEEVEEIVEEQGPIEQGPVEEAPENETHEQMIDRVNRRFQPDTDNFVAKNCDGSTVNYKQNGEWVPDAAVRGNVEEAKKQVEKAQTPEEYAAQRPAELGQDPDPFMYAKGKPLNKTEIDALKSFGLTNDELIAVNLYTGGAYDRMNEVLRGIRKDEPTIRAFLPWCRLVDSALAKMPREVRNQQVGATLSKDGAVGAEEKLGLTTAYRTDEMKGKPAFVERVAKGWNVGGRLTDKGFMSAATTQGAYGEGMSVSQIIDVSGSAAAASVVDLSQNKKENEVLFRPGTTLQFEAIKDNETNEPIKGGKVAKHAKDKGVEVGDLSLTALTKVVGAPAEKKEAKPETGATVDPGAKDAEKEAEIDTVRRVLTKK